MFVNGVACKDPKQVQAEDFYFSGLHLVGNTSNPAGSKATLVNVAQIPGLNTLGISLARIDFAPTGVNPPHSHPRASEIIVVLEGTLEVGFISSGFDLRHISKVLQPGDVFVFPAGLIHYQRNVGSGNAAVIAALNSQSPGTISLASAIFGAEPPIKDELLSKAFQIDKKAISYLRSKF